MVFAPLVLRALGLPRVRARRTQRDVFIHLAALAGLRVADQEFSASPREAYRMAVEASQAGDRVVVFGSFYLVGDILDWQLERTPG